MQILKSAYDHNTTTYLNIENIHEFYEVKQKL